MIYELQTRIRAYVGQPEKPWRKIDESRSKARLHRDMMRLRKEAVGTGFYDAYAGCPEFQIVQCHHRDCIHLRGAVECNCRQLYAFARKCRTTKKVTGPKFALKKIGVSQCT